MIKWFIYILVSVSLGGLVALGILYFRGSSNSEQGETSSTVASSNKQEETKGVDDKVQSSLEVNLARARGYLSEGHQVAEAGLINEQREQLESLFTNFRNSKSDARLKEDSSGISLRYAIEKQGYKLKGDSFEVWTTKDPDVYNLLFILNEGKNDDMYLVLSYEKQANVYHILYLYGGRPDVFG